MDQVIESMEGEIPQAMYDARMDEMVNDFAFRVEMCIRDRDNSSEAEKALLRKVEPHDLVKFGLIPELSGRLPVITVLDDLDEDALVRVLKEPRNSLVKQYKDCLLYTSRCV